VSEVARTQDFDVLVAGGGLAGLVFAGLLLDRCEKHALPLRLGVIEARPPEPARPGENLDLRVSALSPASIALLKSLGAWDELPGAAVCNYEQMCVWQAEGAPDAECSIRFSAAELGVPDLGAIVENRAVRRVLWQRLLQAENVTLIEQHVAAVAADNDGCRVTFADDSRAMTRLLVGADGARSTVRQQLGIQYRERAYGQVAIVAHIASEASHELTAWQRFLSGGPVALLPLSDGRSSLVWSCPKDQAEDLLAMEDDEFSRQLTAALGPVLGALTCDSSRVSFPLAAGHAERYTATRCALIGDAAHRIHPLAGQGVNLGLLDAAALVECVAEFMTRPRVRQQMLADPGDALVLRRYERERKGDNLMTLGAMDVLNGLFTGPVKGLSGKAMGTVNNLNWLKATFARFAMGTSKDLPAAARPR